jgi:hypothetical protein
MKSVDVEYKFQQKNERCTIFEGQKVKYWMKKWNNKCECQNGGMIV